MSYVVVPSIVPNYGFTHQEMIDIVAGELGNISIATKITNWLNMAIIDLASKYEFGPLHSYDSKITSAGIPDLALASDMYWLKTIAIPAQNRKLYPEDEQRISEGYPQYRTLQGSVICYYLNGTTIGLWQVPDSGITIDYSYQRRPIKLINLTDICDLPPEWHTLVIQKAITKGYSQEGNSEGFSISMQLETRLFRELKLSAYRRPDQTFVFGGPDVRGRIPRPKLPSNYPSAGR
jgi:hypothetical protein